MSRNDNQTILAIIAIAFALFTRRSTSVGLSQHCVFPDCSSVDVPLGDPCPFDTSKGGQSVIMEYGQPCEPFSMKG